MDERKCWKARQHFIIYIQIQIYWYTSVFFICFIRQKYVSFNTWQPYTPCSILITMHLHNLMHLKLLTGIRSFWVGMHHHLCAENCVFKYFCFKCIVCIKVSLFSELVDSTNLFSTPYVVDWLLENFERKFFSKVRK